MKSSPKKTIYLYKQIKLKLTHIFSVIYGNCNKWWGRTSGLMITLYTLRVNMELAERRELSADDITAAETAPRPVQLTNEGVRWLITRGSMFLLSPFSRGDLPPTSNLLQSEPKNFMYRAKYYSSVRMKNFRSSMSKLIPLDYEQQTPLKNLFVCA